MVAALVAILLLAAGAAEQETPNIWLAPTGGKLIRAGLEGDPLQTFDVSPMRGTRVFRGRQVAYAEGDTLTWVTAAGGVSHAQTEGKRVVGWRDTEPLLSDGSTLATPAGLKVPVDLKSGEEPVFASFFGDSGTIVSRTSSGTLRIAVTGSPGLAADFGSWRLIEARMVTATSGYLLLEGDGWAVLRIAKGRADLVAMDREHMLGITLASDGRAYVSRRTTKEGDISTGVTDVDEIGPTGHAEAFCRVTGHVLIVDLDRMKKFVYVVEQRDSIARYARISYGSFDPETVLVDKVEFVSPAFGGSGLAIDTSLE